MLRCKYCGLMQGKSVHTQECVDFYNNYYVWLNSLPFYNQLEEGLDAR